MVQDPRYLLLEDFEGGVATSPYWDTTTTYKPYIMANSPMGGYAMKLPGSSATNNTRWVPPTALSGVFSLEVDVNVAGTGYKKVQFLNAVGAVITASFDTNSLFVSNASTSTNVTAVKSLVTQRTYRLKMVIDTNKLRYDVYLDGEKVASDMLFYVANANIDLIWIQFQGASGYATGYMDNIKVYQGRTDPATIETPTPPLLKVGNMTYDAVPLKWVFDKPEGKVTYFEVYRDGRLIEALINTDSYTDREVSGNKTYRYEVYAKSTDGETVANVSNTLEVTTPAMPEGEVLLPNPTPPVLSVLGVTERTVSLGWAYEPTPGYPVYYDILRNGELVGQDVSTRLFTDYTIDYSKQYAYQVVVKDAEGTVVDSNVMQVETGAKPPEPIVDVPVADEPAQPVVPNKTPPNVFLLGVEHDELTVSWSYVPADNHFVYFNIMRNGITIGQAVTGRTFKDLSVEPNKLYNYQIDVMDKAGYVVSSAVETIRTPEAPVVDDGGSTAPPADGGSTNPPKEDDGGSTNPPPDVKVPEGTIPARKYRQLDIKADEPVLLYFGELGVRELTLSIAGEAKVQYKVNKNTVSLDDTDANFLNNYKRFAVVREDSNIYRLAVISDANITIQWDSRRGK